MLAFFLSMKKLRGWYNLFKVDGPMHATETKSTATPLRSNLRHLLDAAQPWLLGLLFILCALPALWPLLTTGFPKTHDGSVHLIRLYLLDEQIRSGNFFPRWLPDLMTGYGYPLFNFYAPAIYLVAETLHLAGLSLPYSLTVVMIALVITAGWGMYFLASDLYETDRDEVGKWRLSWTGLAAAVAYLYTLYFLVNLYVRGALAELLAQALLPWLFWCVRRIFIGTAPQRNAVMSAVLLGSIAISHNITLLLLPGWLGPYLVLLVLIGSGKLHEKVARLGAFFRWALVAAGVTAFFWLPLLGERSLLSKVAFYAPRVEEHVWSFSTFLEFNLPYDYSVSTVPFRLGLAQLLLAVGGLLLTKRRAALWWFWVGIGSLAVVAITPLILPLWRAVELLAVVQFPWRFLTFVSIVTALLAGGIVTALRGPARQAALATGVMLLALAGGYPQVDLFNTSMYEDVAIDPAAIARYEAGYGAWGAGWHREFLPKWAEAFDAPSSTGQSANGSTDLNKPTQVSIRAISTQSLQLSVQSTAATSLRLNQFYFPGWHARLLPQDEPLPVYPSTQQGLVTVDLPAGEHILEIGWADSWLQKIAEWISIATLLILATGFLWRHRLRVTAGLIGAALCLGIFLNTPLWRPAEPFYTVQNELLPGLTLLGYQAEVAANGRSLLITPYWYNQRRFHKLTMTWRMVDRDGTVVSQISSIPYYLWHATCRPLASRRRHPRRLSTSAADGYICRRLSP